MWIRSQDKETLIKCENIYCAGTFVCCGDGAILGEYSSKEKVLKVLDMIQKEICNINEFAMLSNMVKRCDDKYIDIDYDGWVFQMPQDSEVE